MSRLRVGVDLVSIQRVERLVGDVGGSFLRRTWTPQEQAYCAGRADSLAARWAAKEAVLKALGTGLGAVAMTDIEVVIGPGGAPELLLHETAAAESQRQGLASWSVSLSHDGGFAVAMVAAWGPD